MGDSEFKAICTKEGRLHKKANENKQPGGVGTQL